MPLRSSGPRRTWACGAGGKLRPRVAHGPLLAAALAAAALGCEGAAPPTATPPAGTTTNSTLPTTPARAQIAIGPAQLPDRDATRERLDRVLDFTEQGREMRLETHAAWQLMHGVLAFGRDFQMFNQGEPTGVLDWVFAGKPLRGWNLRITDRGIRAEIDPGRLGQGHEDQWLGYLSQAGVPISTPLIVDGKPYKLYDVLKRAMYDCYEGKETSWTLTALSIYLDPLDQKWTARDGEQWSVERLAGLEAGPTFDPELAERHITEAACGGTHRMIALAFAYNRFRDEFPNVEPQGGWLATQQQVLWAIDAARRNQLPSGAFSILCFQRPMNSASIDEHLASTGHVLEFLSIALSDEELEAPWMRRAVHYLCDLLERTREVDLECGALYHAAHGLVMYRERVFGPRSTP